MVFCLDTTGSMGGLIEGGKKLSQPIKLTLYKTCTTFLLTIFQNLFRITGSSRIKPDNKSNQIERFSPFRRNKKDP